MSKDIIIEYKKQTALTDYFESKVQCKKFTKGGFLEKLGFKNIVYPDVYFHTGSLNNHSKLMIENSKLTVINSSILADELVKDLNVKMENLRVILPINDVEKFKKKEVKIPFYEQYNIDEDDKIIYFSAQNFKRNGFEQFCDIITKIESTNFRVFATCTIDKELDYAKKVVTNFNLEDKITFIEDEIYNVADIFILPTLNVNFSTAVVKAVTNKCAVFVPTNNNAIEIVDVFAIMDDPNDSNTAYKVDMLLRVPDELKKIQKENYSIGKKLNTIYQRALLNEIIEEVKEFKEKKALKR
jgi:hypothetical protein